MFLCPAWPNSWVVIHPLSLQTEDVAAGSLLQLGMGPRGDVEPAPWSRREGHTARRPLPFNTRTIA